MSKLVVVVFAVITFVQGRPGVVPDWNSRAAQAILLGEWENFRKVNSSSSNRGDSGVLPVGNIKDLKPIPGVHVYGESELTYHETSNYNGQKTEQSGGHKVINDDGKISENDFKPQISNK